MQTKKPPPQSTQENEIIVSVMILYLAIAAVLLFIHYLQPGTRPAATSSLSHQRMEGK